MDKLELGKCYYYCRESSNENVVAGKYIVVVIKDLKGSYVIRFIFHFDSNSIFLYKNNRTTQFSNLNGIEEINGFLPIFEKIFETEYKVLNGN